MTQADTEPTIRIACEEDFTAVLAMVNALAAHHGDTPALTQDALRRDARGWYHVMVAEAENQIVGYAALLPTGQLQFGVRGIDLHHLYVLENRRGQGVGKGLIDAAIDHARKQGCAYVTVGTDPDNLAAQAVYLARGFERRAGAGARFRLLI